MTKKANGCRDEQLLNILFFCIQAKKMSQANQAGLGEAGPSRSGVSQVIPLMSVSASHLSIWTLDGQRELFEG
jgi:hypothetical protein